jgi:hypothetical protein
VLFLGFDSCFGRAGFNPDAPSFECPVSCQCTRTWLTASAGVALSQAYLGLSAARSFRPCLSASPRSKSIHFRSLDLRCHFEPASFFMSCELGAYLSPLFFGKLRAVCVLCCWAFQAGSMGQIPFMPTRNNYAIISSHKHHDRHIVRLSFFSFSQ